MSVELEAAEVGFCPIFFSDFLCIFGHFWRSEREKSENEDWRENRGRREEKFGEVRTGGRGGDREEEEKKSSSEVGEEEEEEEGDHEAVDEHCEFRDSTAFHVPRSQIPCEREIQDLKCFSSEASKRDNGYV